MRTARLLLLSSFTIVAALSCAASVKPTEAEAVSATLDSDHDGLSDALEQSLLLRFAPAFQVDPHDCAGLPTLFLPEKLDPIATAQDGTIYGQATPHAIPGVAGQLVELRYFHLWTTDCGRFGHALDTEHVSVLIRLSPADNNADGWRALYWYAAAHENTMCDASQITRASTLASETTGASVWISRGKHASFLRKELCRHGCGGDTCDNMRVLVVPQIVNLGEPSFPMNGATWTASSQWPLATKLGRSDFSPALLSRLEQHPSSDIVWVNPSRRPAQATIAVSGTTADALALSSRRTDTAISLAGSATGSALGTTYNKVTHSLERSAQGTGNFLHGRPRKSKPVPAHSDPH